MYTKLPEAKLIFVAEKLKMKRLSYMKEKILVNLGRVLSYIYCKLEKIRPISSHGFDSVFMGYIIKIHYITTTTT